VSFRRSHSGPSNRQYWLRLVSIETDSGDRIGLGLYYLLEFYIDHRGLYKVKLLEIWYECYHYYCRCESTHLSYDWSAVWTS